MRLAKDPIILIDPKRDATLRSVGPCGQLYVRKRRAELERRFDAPPE